MAYKTRKKKVKKNVPEGMAHIHSTFNNTITTLTDKDGNVEEWEHELEKDKLNITVKQEGITMEFECERK